MAPAQISAMPRYSENFFTEVLQHMGCLPMKGAPQRCCCPLTGLIAPLEAPENASGGRWGSDERPRKVPTRSGWKLECSLNEAQAQALGRMMHRIGWNELRALSADEHDLLQMLSALDVVRACLAEGGYLSSAERRRRPRPYPSRR